MAVEKMCACGSPLHYSDPKMRKLVEEIIASHGECIEIEVQGRRFKVPRNFIALHGLKAMDLPVLAEAYGFEEVK